MLSETLGELHQHSVKSTEDFWAHVSLLQQVLMREHMTKWTTDLWPNKIPHVNCSFFFFFFQLAGILCFPGMRRMSERSVCLSFFPVDEHAVKEWKNADILLIWKVSFSSFHPFRKVNNCKDYSIAVTREGKKEKRGEKSLLKSFLRYIEVLFPADCIFFLY